MIASFLGVFPESDKLKLSGAPEFTVAMRTQLLVGQSTYAIQQSPEYAHAFASMEDEGDEEGEQAAHGDPAAVAPAECMMLAKASACAHAGSSIVHADLSGLPDAGGATAEVVVKGRRKHRRRR
jgi:hypothetical protein